MKGYYKQILVIVYNSTAHYAINSKCHLSGLKKPRGNFKNNSWQVEKSVIAEDSSRRKAEKDIKRDRQTLCHARSHVQIELIGRCGERSEAG